MRHLTLRRSHAIVEEELGLKPQLSRTKFLNFSNIEKHNYDVREKKVIQLINQGSLDEKSDNRVSDFLTGLRKLCCHPQFDQHMTKVSDNILSMNEICFKMIEDSR